LRGSFAFAFLDVELTPPSLKTGVGTLIPSMPIKKYRFALGYSSRVIYRTVRSILFFRVESYETRLVLESCT